MMFNNNSRVELILGSICVLRVEGLIKSDKDIRDYIPQPHKIESSRFLYYIFRNSSYCIYVIQSKIPMKGKDLISLDIKPQVIADSYYYVYITVASRELNINREIVNDLEKRLGFVEIDLCTPNKRVVNQINIAATIAENL